MPHKPPHLACIPSDRSGARKREASGRVEVDTHPQPQSLMVKVSRVDTKPSRTVRTAETKTEPPRAVDNHTDGQPESSKMGVTSTAILEEDIEDEDETLSLNTDILTL